jgi:hypothetical protein
VTETATATHENSLVLELDGIETYYGTIRALRGVSLEVREGEIDAARANGGRKRRRRCARSTASTDRVADDHFLWARRSRLFPPTAS